MKRIATAQQRLDRIIDLSGDDLSEMFNDAGCTVVINLE